MKERGLRRHNTARIKTKVKRVVLSGSYDGHHHTPPTEKRIGKLAAVHMRPCSCVGCQANNRRPEEKFKIDVDD